LLEEEEDSPEESDNSGLMNISHRPKSPIVSSPPRENVVVPVHTEGTYEKGGRRMTTDGSESDDTIVDLPPTLTQDYNTSKPMHVSLRSLVKGSAFSAKKSGYEILKKRKSPKIESSKSKSKRRMRSRDFVTSRQKSPKMKKQTTAKKGVSKSRSKSKGGEYNKIRAFSRGLHSNKKINQKFKELREARQRRIQNSLKVHMQFHNLNCDDQT